MLQKSDLPLLLQLWKCNERNNVLPTGLHVPFPIKRFGTFS